MILADNYLHFKFADMVDDRNSYDPLSQFAYAKNGIQNLALQGEQLPAETYVAENLTEYENLLDFFRRPEYKITKRTKQTNPQNTEYSWDSKFSDEITGRSEDLANDISLFVNMLKAITGEICKQLGVNFQEYAAQLVAEYAQNNSYSSHASLIGYDILSSFLSTDGFKKIHTSQVANGGLGKFIESAALLIETLPSYTGDAEIGTIKYQASDGSTQETKNGKETIFRLLEKIQGLYETAVDDGAEIAWEKIKENLFVTYVEALDKLNKEVALRGQYGNSGKSNLQITANTIFNNTKKSDTNRTLVNLTKPGVNIIVTNDLVRITYETSIKEYRGSKSIKYSNLGMASSVSFLMGVQMAYPNITTNNLVNLAAARPGYGISSHEKYDEEEISKTWGNVVQNTVTASLLSSISTLIGLEGYKNTYLTLGGKAIHISEVILNLRTSMQTGFAENAFFSNNFSRDNFTASNEWIWQNKKSKDYYSDRNLNKALERSKKLYHPVLEKLNQAKMDISLRNLESLL